MKFKQVLGSMVLVDITHFAGVTEEKTESGIIIQKNMKDLVREVADGKTQSGFVAQVGDKCQLVSEGDEVLLPISKGHIKGRLEADGRVFIWVSEDHIPAILEK